MLLKSHNKFSLLVNSDLIKSFEQWKEQELLQNKVCILYYLDCSENLHAIYTCLNLAIKCVFNKYMIRNTGILPIYFRVELKALVITYKTLHRLGPRNLRDHLFPRVSTYPIKLNKTDMLQI